MTSTSSSVVQTEMLTSLRQCPTPLNSLFFSDFNLHVIQRGIRQKVKNTTGIAIDYQNQSDLLAIMRAEFINNSTNQTVDVCSQVKFINTRVMNTAIGQINTNLSQYIGYIKDINSPNLPLALPVNTNQYGNKIDLNYKIGL